MERLLAFLKKHRNIVFVVVVLLGASLVYYAATPSVQHGGNLPEIAELAESTDWSFQQYSDYFRRLADEKGAEYAFDVLLYAPITPGTDIHLLAHTVGDMLYKQQGMEGIYACTQDFRNACSHSVVIGILNEFGEGALGDIAATCRKAPGGLGAYTMCFHGLGHGVLAFNGYKFEKAVEMCKKTGTADYHNREYIECVGGATMEIVAGVHDPEAWKREVVTYLTESEPLSPCTSSFMDTEAQPICLMHLTPHLFELAGMDLGKPDPATFPEAFSFCDTLPEGDFANRNACYGGFGKEFIGIVQGRDIRNVGEIPESGLMTMRNWCALAGNLSGERDCNAHTLASLYWGGENDIDASLSFCSLANGTEQNDCYQQLVGHIRFYFPSLAERAGRCNALPVLYKNACLSA